MLRQIWLVAVVTLCGACSKPADTQTSSPAGAKIAPPSAAGSGRPAIGSPAIDPRFNLQPDEGTLSIDKAEGKAGAELVANIKITPASGRHVSTEFPIKVTLEAPPGVKLAKTDFKAGGPDKAQGDAATLSEQLLAFAVKATAAQPGSYEITGVLQFGVCDKDSCHPKKQPIAISVAAN